MTQREDKERLKSKREKMASFFLDLAKLTFTAMVLGGLSPIFGGAGIADVVNIAFGIALTFVFARIGNKILD